MLTQFTNEGFGWICIACSKSVSEHEPVSRLFSEGEAETKSPVMSEPALAKWSNPEKTELVCPRCGASGRLAD